MPRDRLVTRARILAATEQLIARKGLHAAGVNAIAAAAGVDKVLIYRYFGGRTQLLRALARERRLWPDFEPPHGDAGLPLAADLSTMLLDAARALRTSPLARRAAAWELGERDEFARELASARDEHARAIAAALRSRHRIPPFVDLEAVIALFAASLTHLALHTGSAYNGLDFRRDDEWLRAERTLKRAAQALLGAPDE